MTEITMLCRGCGQKISLIGKVCPHCQRDKTADAEEHSRLVLYCMGFGAVGAFLGYLLSNGFFGQIAGISIGMICGLIVGAIFAFLNAKVPTPSLPPEVRISPNANAVESHEESQIALTIESRLSKLDALKVKGLVSSEEYARKREKILNSL